MHAASQTSAGAVLLAHELCHDLLDSAAPADVLAVITVAGDHSIVTREGRLNARHDCFLTIIPAAAWNEVCWVLMAVIIAGEGCMLKQDAYICCWWPVLSCRKQHYSVFGNQSRVLLGN